MSQSQSFFVLRFSGAVQDDGYAWIPASILSNPDLSPNAKLTYVALACREFRRTAKARLAELLTLTGLPRRTLYRTLIELRTAGIVTPNNTRRQLQTFKRTYALPSQPGQGVAFPRAALRLSLDPQQFVTLAIFAMSHDRGDGIVFFNREKLGAKLGVSGRTVSRIIATLVDAGLLTRLDRTEVGEATRYDIAPFISRVNVLIPEVQESQPTTPAIQEVAAPATLLPPAAPAITTPTKTPELAPTSAAPERKRYGTPSYITTVQPYRYTNSTWTLNDRNDQEIRIREHYFRDRHASSATFAPFVCNALRRHDHFQQFRELTNGQLFERWEALDHFIKENWNRPSGPNWPQATRDILTAMKIEGSAPSEIDPDEDADGMTESAATPIVTRHQQPEMTADEFFEFFGCKGARQS